MRITVTGLRLCAVAGFLLCLAVSECLAWPCEYPTSASISVSNRVVCYPQGRSHSISVSATDADGIWKTEIWAAGSRIKSCTPPGYPSSASCSASWSSAGVADTPGVYAICGKIWDRCGTENPDKIVTKNIYVIGGPLGCHGQCGDTVYCHMLVKCPASGSQLYAFGADLDQPAGTNYDWDITEGTEKAHIESADNTRIIAVKPDAGGDGTLQCRYGIQIGTTWYWCYPTAGYYKNFHCQAPSQGHSTRQIGQFWRSDGPPLWEMEVLVTYTVRDQDGFPICAAWWDETPSGADGDGCPTIDKDLDVLTKANGKLNNEWEADRFYWSQGSDWDRESLICRWTQTIKVSGCPSAGSFWTNEIEFTQEPSITVTAQ